MSEFEQGCAVVGRRRNVLRWTCAADDWRTRPPCGGGQGWGVARAFAIGQPPLQSLRFRTVRPPSSVLPHKGGGCASGKPQEPLHLFERRLPPRVVDRPPIVRIDQRKIPQFASPDRCPARPARINFSTVWTRLFCTPSRATSATNGRKRVRNPCGSGRKRLRGESQRRRSRIRHSARPSPSRASPPAATSSAPPRTRSAKAPSASARRAFEHVRSARSRPASGRACTRRCGRARRAPSTSPIRARRSRLQAVTWRRHSSGSSQSTASRARASSPRFVSWVARRQHRVRPALGALGVRLVEEPRRDAEPLRRAADLVQRDEAVVAIEGGVLDALGHHRTGELLQPHGEAKRRGPADALASQRFGVTAGNALRGSRRPTDGGRGRRGARARSPRRCRAGPRRRAAPDEIEIGAVDGKVGDDRA